MTITMIRPRPLHSVAVPEVLLHVYRYVDRKTLKDHLCVNHHFYNTLLPLVWYRIKLPCEFASLEKHSSLIQEAVITIPESPTLLHRLPALCPVLSVLELNRTVLYPVPQERQTWSESERQEYANQFRCVEQLLIEYISRHRTTLCKISIEGEVTSQLLDVLASCPRLIQLKLNKVVLRVSTPMEWINYHDSLWSCLEVLQLHLLPFFDDNWNERSSSNDEICDRFSNPAGLFRPTRFCELDLRTIGTNLEYPWIQRLLIQTSPRLKKLNWGVEDIREYEVVITPLLVLSSIVVTMAQDGLDCCQGIETLALPQAEFRTEDLQDLFDNLPSLASLDFSGTNFNEEHWQLFQNHARGPAGSCSLPQGYLLDTITELNLLQCMELTGWEIQGMLCSMRNLVVFKADTLDETDLWHDPRPWSCLGLKELALTFLRVIVQGAETVDTTETRVFSRLATLKELQVLDLNPNMGIVTRARARAALDRSLTELQSPARLHFTLEKGGLDHLRTLGRLRHVRAPGGSGSCWSAAEVQWVSYHWRGLRKLLGVKMDHDLEGLLPNCTFSF